MNKKILSKHEVNLKICFASRECFPTYYGGIGSHFYAQMKMLKNFGHDIVFITHKYENANIDELIDYYEGIEVVFTDKTRQYFPTHDNLNNSHLLWQSIHNLITKEAYHFDYIIFPDCGAEGFFTILVNTIYKIYSNTKILIEIEGPMKYVAIYNKDLVDDHFELTKLMEEFCFSRCAYYTSPTRIMLKEVENCIDINRVKSTIVPNLVNYSFIDVQRKESISEKNILFIGRLEYRKGPDLLINSFKEVNKEINNEKIYLKLVGRDQFWTEYNNSFKEYWSKHIEENNMNVSFLDFLNHGELNDLFASTWVAVFPSRWEPFGNVALEAILSGVPVIVPEGTWFGRNSRRGL